MSVDILEEAGVDAYKIPSGEITNIPLLRYIAGKKKPIILSTGMAEIDEIARAVDLFRIPAYGILSFSTVLPVTRLRPKP